MATPVDELPTTLQLMIADAQNAIANGAPEHDPQDRSIGAGDDWIFRLSRGEFDEELYWDCVADDCEEAGDWNGALSAYRKILDLPGLSGMKFSNACGSVAAIQSLLGDDRAALASAQRATAKFRDDSLILRRGYILREISQLLEMGRVHRARKLIRCWLAAVHGETVDHLGTARLHIASAKCDLASRKPTKAAESLQLAWDWLDALITTYPSELLQQATGIHKAYMTWWATEAKRRRIANEGNSEIEALKHAIEKARLCFTPCGWQAPWHDLALMNLLVEVADAYERHDQLAAAATSRREAEEIFARRKFPESAKRHKGPHRRSTRFAFLRNWWRKY